MTVKIEKHVGVYFTLEPIDFRFCNWEKLLQEVKKLYGSEYNGESKVWFIPEPHIQKFFELKKQYIDSIIHKDQISLFEE